MKVSHKTKAAAAEVKLNLMESCFYPLFYKRHKDVESREGIRYGQGKRQLLDVYAKDAIGKPRPVFIYIHGGGWISGLRTARRYYCRRWAEEDYVVLNIGYDYGAEIRHPSHLRDVFKGIDYALDRAEEWGLDTSQGVVVAGESAGAYLAAYVAAASVHREIYDKFGIDFAHADDFKVNACVLLSGVYSMSRVASCKFPDIDVIAKTVCGMDTHEIRALDDESRRRADELFSPEIYADADFPAAFVVGSDSDPLKGESEGFFGALHESGADCEYFLCTGLNGVHAGALACDLAESGRQCVKSAVEFVAHALGRGSVQPNG